MWCFISRRPWEVKVEEVYRPAYHYYCGWIGGPGMLCFTEYSVDGTNTAKRKRPCSPVGPNSCTLTHVARYLFSLGSEWQPRVYQGLEPPNFHSCHQDGQQRERELDQLLPSFLYLSIWQMIAALRRIRHVTGYSHLRSRGSSVASKASYESRDDTCHAGCRFLPWNFFPKSSRRRG